MSVQANGTKKVVANQPKKLVIKNLRVSGQVPANFEEETWTKLQRAIQRIQTNTHNPDSLEELYKAAEDLCKQKWSANLYTRMQAECNTHVQSLVGNLLGQTSDPVLYLKLVNNCWLQHCNNMIDIRSILLYLDRTYVIQTPNVCSIWDLGLQLFRQHVMIHPEVERKTVASFLALVKRARDGEAIDRSLLHSVSKMFVSLGMYAESFEKPFLEETKMYYTTEGEVRLSEMEVAEYLRHVESRLHEESERVLHYLDSSTKKMLIVLVERQLLEVHVDAILQKGFASLMTNHRHEDLRRMYNLFARVGALDKLKAQWNTYIKTVGAQMVNDTEKDKTLVQDLLEFKSKLDYILEESFTKSDVFAYSLKEAFEHFINTRANKPAELIAKFIHGKLTSGYKGTSEEELEQLLDKIMVLFRYINGKDVFEAFYKKDLAKRLLLNKSASIDAEKAMISKLKTECGASFTNKLEGMFKDMEISKDTMKTFKESEIYTKSPHKDVDLNVFVLTHGYWPPFPTMELQMPKEMADQQELFKRFYLSKHNGRKLTWQNGMGVCQLKANFKASKKELSVSLSQTVVLLQFNDKPELSFNEIAGAAGIDTKEAKKALQSLSLGKVKILKQRTPSKEIAEDDVFSVNDQFKHKMYRIKINSMQLKEDETENKKTTQGVMNDRQYQVDAAIVRIMKTRKTLTHNQLITELYAQLKFPIKPVDLKKRIESLIDREYLERDSKNSQVYNYLA